MKYIKKGNAPASLVYHKKQSFSTYDNYKEKDDVRTSLLQEQGFICCYCMSRINKRSMKIEHWLSQSENEENTLDYKIMLGGCLGFQNSPYNKQCCDTHRKNIKLTINPTDQFMVDTIKYLTNGKIISENADYNNDIDVTLNLNTELLRENRKSLYRAMISFMGKRKEPWNESDIRRAIKRYLSKDENGAYVPYCQVALYFLQKRLSKHKVR
ncbi:TIGR02646 family protein [Bacillus thuringiensis]|uniref:retron system putative HNH endonuclease n=1 Tax=Bacillus cereus group TaxID=86661 RepID=UPI000BEDB200|nr:MULTISPECIES: retron system putative HNH endonuclease [Bacillus cereus group]PEA48703.1 TIGR02646 family protein [Bacillus thuringiensis]PES89575.1 TIGR02646 family protein [Bacillus thuringiensis]PEZ71052.1 TIGR02646 family protein [Bacillus thuringiensis]PFE05043.1 TIGR02646 family protein [Bacillus thuringiensis]PFT59026.1 TIGR02646 family protein [Bacillus thuringiensis]